MLINMNTDYTNRINPYIKIALILWLLIVSVTVDIEPPAFRHKAAVNRFIVQHEQWPL